MKTTSSSQSYFTCVYFFYVLLYLLSFNGQNTFSRLDRKKNGLKVLTLESQLLTKMVLARVFNRK